jgi:hypothetical protein
MTEGTPPTPEQLRQLNRDLMEKMLDKAASDPAWKQRLLDDWEGAMMETDFPEARQLQQMLASLGAQEEAEVTGHLSPVPNVEPCPPPTSAWGYGICPPCG